MNNSHEKRIQRLKDQATRQGISLSELQHQLDLQMQQEGGPTFEEGIEKVCYIIAPQATKRHPRTRDLLQVDTDYLRYNEANEEIDNALNKLGVRPEVLAVMEVAVKVDKPKLHSKRKKGEGWDPLFEVFHNARLD